VLGCTPVSLALVPQTGQTQCWDTGGTPIDCAGTGQDGEIQAGMVPPDPRFTDNEDGTVTDNLTRLIWLKDANCFGRQTWQEALNAANNLAGDPTSTNTDCGLSDGSMTGDWRLPNIKELLSLIDIGQFDPDSPAGHPFSDVQSNFYWPSTTPVDAPNLALRLDVGNGNLGSNVKTADHFVWPVRGGLQLL
jgi:Protein of unknown function (DUF1566)